MQSIFSGTTYSDKSIQRTTEKSPKEQEFPLKCTKGNKKHACPKKYYPTTTHNPDRPISSSSSNETCPSYFRWIHEDLRHWKHTGITRDMVERARKTAHFRLVIVNGKAYVEKYRQSIQTRDMFSLWGILQLLRLYPGRLPDLELMFDCDDRPVVQSKDFRGPHKGPPPLFRYCSDRWSLDIVFPDWSFWGWYVNQSCLLHWPKGKYDPLHFMAKMLFLESNNIPSTREKYKFKTKKGGKIKLLHRLDLILLGPRSI